MTSPGGPVDAAPVILFASVRLIDGTSPEARPDIDVLVRGARIAAVGPADPQVRDDAARNGSIRVIDGAGRTLLPGLIDCHAHYLLDATAPEMFTWEERESDARVVLKGARSAERALLSGVTTARSAGAPRGLDIPLARAIEAMDVPGPRLLAAGHAITITGGHGWRFGRQADGDLELRRAVRTNVRDGADVIKAVASEAAMLTTSVAGVSEMTERDLRAIVEEAARLRRRVLAHAQGPASVADAARAGVASVEHAFLADDAALEVLAAAGATLVPTLVVTDVYSALPDLSPAQRDRQATLKRLHRRSCETAVRLGIPLATGTDTGVTGVTSDLIGREVELLHDHGLSAMASIQAATATAAALLGVDDQVGRVEPGLQADLLLVDGDPLTDLARLSSPTLVMQAGRIITGSEIKDH